MILATKIYVPCVYSALPHIGQTMVATIFFLALMSLSTAVTLVQIPGGTTPLRTGRTLRRGHPSGPT